MSTTYLGMPLGNEYKALEIWDGIVEKTEKKLARWKAQYLSLGCRLTLIKSALDSLPTYVISLSPIPSKVVKKLDKLRRNFLWQGCNEGSGYNLVKWETILLSKKRGGLGIKNLSIQNNCLMMKWLWRYNSEEHALRKKVINTKVGETNPCWTKTVTESYGVGVWRATWVLWPLRKANLKLKIGDREQDAVLDRSLD